MASAGMSKVLRKQLGQGMRCHRLVLLCGEGSQHSPKVVLQLLLRLPPLKDIINCIHLILK